MRRTALLATSILVLLSVAVPQGAVQATADRHSDHPARSLTASWWNWVVSTSPSPLEGSYDGGQRCDGSFVRGAFFLAGTTASEPVERTCTVPAGKPILFPVVNALCSEGFDPPDPRPFWVCAKSLLDSALEGDSEVFARVDGEAVEIRRIAGHFAWRIPSDDNLFAIPAGRYDAAGNGLWVYLPHGLRPGQHTIHFGGSFFDGGFLQDITYHLRVQRSWS
jgi:hypothetical protein